MVNDKQVNKNLIKNTGIIGIGRLSTKAISFLLLPLYTGRLSTEDYGIVDLMLTYGALLIPIVNLQLENAIFRFTVENRDDDKKMNSYFSSSCFASFVLIITFLFLYVIIGPFINYSNIFWMILYVISSILLVNMSYAVRGIGNNLCFSIGNFLSSLTTLVLSVLFITVFQFGVAGILMSYFIGPTIGAIYIFFIGNIYKYISAKNISFYAIKEMLGFSLPLVPNELSWWVIKASDRTIVSIFIGIFATGILAAANKFSLIFTTVFQVFYSSWLEQIMAIQKKDGGLVYFKKMFQDFMYFFWGASLCFISIIPFIFKIMVDKEYYSGYSLISLYILAAFFNAIIGLLSPIYLGHDETKIIARTTILAGVLNIIINIAFIKYIGLMAAAISSVCAYSIIAFIRLNDVNKRYIKLEVFNRKFILYSILTLFTIGFYNINNMIIKILCSLFIITYFMFENKPLFMNIINLIRGRQ